MVVRPVRGSDVREIVAVLVAEVAVNLVVWVCAAARGCGSASGAVRTGADVSFRECGGAGAVGCRARHCGWLCVG